MSFGLILTAAGASQIELAYQAGEVIRITVVALGDGGGAAVTTDPAVTELVNPFGEVPFSQGGTESGMISGQAVINARDYPGKVVREFGLMSADGVLIAYGAYPETYLPDQSDAIIKELVVNFVMPLAHTECVELVVDPNIAIITQEEGDKRYYRRSLRLQEVQDEGAAAQQELRENIGCGTAATRNVAEGADGDLIPVGYKGIFTENVYHAPIDFATYPFVVGESLFIDARSSTNNPPFLNQDFYYIDVVCATGPAQGGRVNRPLIQFISYSNSTAIYAIREDDGTTIGWRYFREVQYDEDNATITAPGALRAFGGRTELMDTAVAIRGAGNKHLWFFGPEDKEVALIWAGDDNVLRLRAGEGPALFITQDGDVSAPSYLGAAGDIHSSKNISGDGFIQAGTGVYDTPGVRVYSPNNPPPPQDLSPYATQEWVAANFLQAGQRLASLGTATNNNNDNEFAYAPDGAIVTAVQQKTNFTAVQYRYVQYNINGNWYTAWVA